MQHEINKLHTDWKEILSTFDYSDINSMLEKEYEIFENVLDIYPPKELIFNCFNHFNRSELKVVILGQDPYINKNEAMGLSFSVPNNIKNPPSLRNILKEVNNSMNLEIDFKNKGDLTKWADQGVMLLNTSLTVLESKSNHHKKIWKDFSDFIIKKLSDDFNNIVFILWGRTAQIKEKFIDSDKHLILKSGHPSPLNCKHDFIGNNHFKLVNEYLLKIDKKEIDWNI